MPTDTPPLFMGRLGPVPNERNCYAMATSDEGWIWAALANCCHATDVLMKLVPEGFDWNGVHPKHGTPLMATVNEIVRSGDVTKDVKKLLEWCLQQGADPRMVAHGVEGASGGWGKGDEEFPMVDHVRHNGESAISLVLGLIVVLERITMYEHRGKYHLQLAAAKQLMVIFADYRPRTETEPISKSCVAMWTSLRHDLDDADVEFVLTDRASGSEASSSQDERGKNCIGGADATRIKGHSLVLKQASPMLRALLSSEMEESKTHVIPVPGAGCAALNMLLSVMYLGKAPDPLPCMQGRAGKIWEVGDKVDANWRGRGKWWPCTITWVYALGQCDVTYDSEEGEAAYHEKKVKPQYLKTRAPINETEIVQHLHMHLEAVDVAHRWNVRCAVEVLEESLAEELRHVSLRGCRCCLSNQSFQSVCEAIEDAANLKELLMLQRVCQDVRRERAKLVKS